MKILATGACVLLAMAHAYACDVCGAVNSSLGLGTVALGNRHSIGLTYQYRTYDSNHPPLFNEPSVHSNECFRRIDLSANIRLANRWQLKAVLPYAYNQQSKIGGTATQYGIGDPTLSVHYFVIDRQDSLGARNMRWSIGAGGKLPLGRFPQPDNNVLLLYPGTGSWDAVLQSSLYFRKGNWGLIQETSGVIRTTNRYNYTPGSLLNATAFVFRKFGNWSLFSGLQYAWNGTDYLDRKPVGSSPSEGSILTLAVGGTIQWRNILVQASYHLPVVQQLGSGYTEQRTSFNIGVHYIFN